jgi:H/ACA ribonucleoprotein complex subunit 4
VYSISFIEKQGEKILGKVRCESGFYVRVLIDQLGEKLNTEAEMTELRRTMQGEITEDETSKIQDVVDRYHFHLEDEDSSLDEIIHPREKAVEHLRKVAVKDSAVNAVANGADLGASGISKLQGDISEGETIAVMTLKGELIALAEAQMNSQSLYEEEGIAATLKSVHMDPKTYPKRWKQS